MKNIFSIFSRESLREAFSVLSRRFPLPTVIVLLITGVFLYVINAEKDDILYARIILSGVVMFFLSIGTTLAIESSKSQKNLSWVKILPILYGVWFYLTVSPQESWSVQSTTYFLLHLTGFLSFLFFAPYLRHLGSGGKDIEYTNYFTRTAWTLLMSIIVGVSLLLLGFIALYAVTTLFDVFSSTTESKLYGNWATIALSLLAPLYGLVHFPRLGDADEKHYETNRFFSFLVKYVAVPFIFIYFAILYAYSVKVILNFSDWPKGVVTWLVIGFSSFGYLAYIFSKPYEEGAVIRLFRRYFPYAVIPQIGMLGYAIYLRISQYDLTMNRYFVVLFGLWLFGVSLYYIVSKGRHLGVIVASLALISLTISVGQWSVFSYPQDRQEARLLRHLEQAHILQDGKIVPLASERDISKELSTEIAGGIEYLCSYDDCARVKSIFPEQTARAEEKARIEWESWNKDNTGATYDGASYWQIQNSIVTELKVQRYPYDDEKREFDEPEYLSYSVDSGKGQYPLDIRGYDTLLQVTSESDPKVPNPELSYPYVTINPDTLAVRYHKAKDTTETYTLALPEKLRDSATLSLLDPSDLTFVVGDADTEIRLVLQSLTVKNPRYIPPADAPTRNTAYIGGAYGLALVKEKK